MVGIGGKGTCNVVRQVFVFFTEVCHCALQAVEFENAVALSSKPEVLFVIFVYLVYSLVAWQLVVRKRVECFVLSVVARSDSFTPTCP